MYVCLVDEHIPSSMKVRIMLASFGGCPVDLESLAGYVAVADESEGMSLYCCDSSRRGLKGDYYGFGSSLGVLDSAWRHDPSCSEVCVEAEVAATWFVWAREPVLHVA